MKKEFVDPNVEYIQFEENSVIETSGGDEYPSGGNHGNQGSGNQTNPVNPNPVNPNPVNPNPVNPNPGRRN